MNKYLKIILGLMGISLLGISYPQIIVGIVIGSVVTFFLEPLLKEYFKKEEKKHVD